MHIQLTQKINVWAVILADHIVGQCFNNSNLNGSPDLLLLYETINPKITGHCAAPVRQFFNEEFTGSWNGKEGTEE